MDLGKAAEPEGARDAPASARAGWAVVLALAVGYVGIYLCRKNLSVAMPLLQADFHATKEQVGRIASVSTLAYAAGKIVNGVAVDRIGGRRGFLLTLIAVAAMGAAGAFAPGLAVLTLFYSLNRFAGSAGWGAMLKLVPTWFPPARTGTAVAVLSLSFVLGGAVATLLARQILGAGGGWRAIMGLPSAVLLVIAVGCAILVREGPLVKAEREREAAAIEAGAAPREDPGRLSAALDLFRRPQFLVVCALSFTITLMRESFNTWSVDFLSTIQVAGNKSLASAALQSTAFDLMGGVSILAAGWAYDNVPADRRRWLMAGMLGVLAVVLAVLHRVVTASPGSGMALIGLTGLLVYGPYSLLAGALAVEGGGPRLAATAAGIIDAVGYLAGALAGSVLGKLLDVGGYGLGFGALAGVTAVSALISLGLRPPRVTVP